jgi:hypothetical protein
LRTLAAVCRKKYGKSKLAEARRVDEICRRVMGELTPGVPIETEYALTSRWSKAAQAVYDSEGRLIPCEPVGGC